VADFVGGCSRTKIRGPSIRWFGTMLKQCARLVSECRAELRHWNELDGGAALSFKKSFEMDKLVPRGWHYSAVFVDSSGRARRN
jgi:hypothetical protein